jgi:phosphoribosylcarboxyaminoimidazole (NCAIR) mutase
VLKIRQLVQVIALLLSSVLLVLAIVFAEAKQAGRTCQSITITMTGKAASQLVDERVLLNQLAAKTTMPIVGAPLQALETQKIENIVKTNDLCVQGLPTKIGKETCA